jgi:hypothetical protein
MERCGLDAVPYDGGKNYLLEKSINLWRNTLRFVMRHEGNIRLDGTEFTLIDGDGKPLEQFTLEEARGIQVLANKVGKEQLRNDLDRLSVSS